MLSRNDVLRSLQDLGVHLDGWEPDALLDRFTVEDGSRNVRIASRSVSAETILCSNRASYPSHRNHATCAGSTADDLVVPGCACLSYHCSFFRPGFIRIAVICHRGKGKGVSPCRSEACFPGSTLRKLVGSVAALKSCPIEYPRPLCTTPKACLSNDRTYGVNSPVGSMPPLIPSGGLASVRFLHASRGKQGRRQPQRRQRQQPDQRKEGRRQGQKRAGGSPDQPSPLLAAPAATLGHQRTLSWGRVVRRRRYSQHADTPFPTEITRFVAHVIACRSICSPRVYSDRPSSTAPTMHWVSGGSTVRGRHSRPTETTTTTTTPKSGDKPYYHWASSAPPSGGGWRQENVNEEEIGPATRPRTRTGSAGRRASAEAMMEGSSPPLSLRSRAPRGGRGARGECLVTNVAQASKMLDGLLENQQELEAFLEEEIAKREREGGRGGERGFPRRQKGVVQIKSADGLVKL